MAGKPSQPTFLWQAVLILLPVAVLSVIGWVSLRQDKALAEQDAKAHAQAIAEQMLSTLPTITSRGNTAFEIDEKGHLVSPPPCDPVPSPSPFSTAEFSPEQTRLWARLQIIMTNALADATTDCQQFIRSNPPERFAAIAQYQLGELFLQQHDWDAAVKAFYLVATEYPEAVGESGVPLRPLAQLKMIELQPASLDSGVARFKLNVPRGVAERNGMLLPDILIDVKYFVPVDSFCSNIVNHPTLLTPFLLQRVRSSQTNQTETVRKWEHVWAANERVWEVYAAVRDQLRVDSSGPLFSVSTNKFEKGLIFSPPMFCFSHPTPPTNRISGTQNWIATRADGGTNRTWFLCQPESEIGSAVSAYAAHLPNYFGIGVEIAGRRIVDQAPVLNFRGNEHAGDGMGGARTINLLASATRAENGAELFKVNVYLANPNALYATQKARALWFGLLVIVSTSAALIGLFAAARAFHRQLRLTEMKSNFVSSVSHELRAPIASVRLMAESLERGKVKDAEKQGEYFRFIVQECRRLSSLIENVLDFSRIEQGRKQYEFEPTDLLALTRETVKLMEPYAEEKGVELETSNLEHRMPNVEAEVDGRAIQQALVNLIDNAIKHSAKGQIVTIGLDAAERASGVPPGSPNPSCAINKTLGQNNSEPLKLPVLLYVEDHGAGIPPAEHEKIFERFYRLGSELRRETQGVGIGLSIVRHIVEAHGGQVTVRSNVGEGSRFTIVLPVKNIETTDEHGFKK